MSSWEKLQEFGKQLAEELPGTWDLGAFGWAVILMRSDSKVRIAIDDSFNIQVEVATDRVIPAFGQYGANTSKLLKFKTKHRKPNKVADLLVKNVPGIIQ